MAHARSPRSIRPYVGYIEVARLLCVLTGLAAGTVLAPRPYVLPAQVVCVIMGYFAGSLLGRGASVLSRAAGQRIERDLAPHALVGGVVGLGGVLLGYVVSYPLRNPVLVPLRVGYASVAVVVWIAGGAGWILGRNYADAIFNAFGVSLRSLVRTVDYAASDGVILDTSVVMDGMLLPLARSGLIPGEMFVPDCVLGELQAWADAESTPTAKRARAGLEQLRAIKDGGWQKVTVLTEQAPEVEPVDAKVVALARRLRLAVATSDQALSDAAALQGIRVISTRHLAGARAPTTRGEVIEIDLVKSGKGPGQAVGYLPSGDMVVVEGGSARINQRVAVTMTHTVATAKGRLFFATICADEPIDLEETRPPLAV